MEWIKTSEKEPGQGIVVDTKIEDNKGTRNEQQLQLIGRLWFHPDGKTYVYYTPTHWRSIETTLF